MQVNQQVAVRPLAEDKNDRHQGSRIEFSSRYLANYNCPTIGPLLRHSLRLILTESYPSRKNRSYIRTNMTFISLLQNPLRDIIRGIQNEERSAGLPCDNHRQKHRVKECLCPAPEHSHWLLLSAAAQQLQSSHGYRPHARRSTLQSRGTPNKLSKYYVKHSEITYKQLYTNTNQICRAVFGRDPYVFTCSTFHHSTVL